MGDFTRRLFWAIVGSLYFFPISVLLGLMLDNPMRNVGIDLGQYQGIVASHLLMCVGLFFDQD